jgi:hypothetical protein
MLVAVSHSRVITSESGIPRGKKRAGSRKCYVSKKGRPKFGCDSHLLFLATASDADAYPAQRFFCSPHPFSMILRRERITWFNIASILLLAWAQLVDADDIFACKVGTEAGIFDLTSLKSEYPLKNITRETPPTKIIDSVRINLCEDIQKQEGLKDTDQVRRFSVFFELV